MIQRKEIDFILNYAASGISIFLQAKRVKPVGLARSTLYFWWGELAFSIPKSSGSRPA
jgi:hypothetical protein